MESNIYKLWTGDLDQFVIGLQYWNGLLFTYYY